MRGGDAVAIAEGLEYNSIASVANLSGNSLMDASEELGRAVQVKSHSLTAISLLRRIVFLTRCDVESRKTTR